MKPKYVSKGNYWVKPIVVKHHITSIVLEGVIATMIQGNEKVISKKEIIKNLRVTLQNGGSNAWDYLYEGCGEDEIDKVSEEAKRISKKLFPHFYKELKIKKNK